MTTEHENREIAHDESDRAPGSPGPEEATPRAALVSYAIGLVLSVALTAGSFYMLDFKFVWGPSIPVALIALAVAQIGVHLVFFLHLTTAPDNTNNILALAFGILIVGLVVAGSIWIMANLNQNMMPMNLPEF